ncbi:MULTISPECIES: aspartate aminotransferase family protein [Pseudomonas]|uniref:aspartate aminotransferase family protein n=1 Tax=Pseudomonas sp. FW305-E2 TaxID=2075558 RepID=UPI001A92F7B9|nr:MULTISPECIES: aspartate aminotransferase family protein [Pseudomonas]
MGELKDAMDIANRVLPGGSFNSVAFGAASNVIVKSGLGCKVTDISGREYFDCINGSGPMLLGHAHPEVVEAVRKAAECPSNFYVLNDKGIELAEKLVEAIPCAEQIKYGVSGSDATFFAMRIARAVTGRSKILKFEGGFLGVNDYALMGMGPSPDIEPHYPQAVPDSAGIPASLESEVFVVPFNNIAIVREVIQRNGNEIAAVIIEAQHRCIDPAPGFLESLRDITKRAGILLIFDEVVTGFRLAYGGAQQRYGVVPDLATYGKVVGGGMPLSAVAGSAELLSRCDPHKASNPDYCYISSTMSGHALPASAGIATLNVLSRDGVYERLYEIGDRFRAGVRDVFRHRGMDVQLPGSGPLTTVVISKDEVTDYRTSVKGDINLQKRLMARMVENGVLTHGKFYLSLAFSNADIDHVVHIMDESLGQVLARK